MATAIGTELRRLLKKLGGTPSKYDQTNELIHKITDQVEPGGGGGLPDISWTDLTGGSGKLFACRKSGIVFLSNMGTGMSGLTVTELPSEFQFDDAGYGGAIIAPVFKENYAATVTGRLVIGSDGSLEYHDAPNETGGGSMLVSYPAKST